MHMKVLDVAAALSSCSKNDCRSCPLDQTPECKKKLYTAALGYIEASDAYKSAKLKYTILRNHAMLDLGITHATLHAASFDKKVKLRDAINDKVSALLAEQLLDGPEAGDKFYYVTVGTGEIRVHTVVKVEQLTDSLFRITDEQGATYLTDDRNLCFDRELAEDISWTVQLARNN